VVLVGVGVVLFYGLWLCTIVHTYKIKCGHSNCVSCRLYLNLASESEEESSNDDEGIIATLATVIVRKKTIDDVITRKQMTAWNFILY
jgi:hypothetical protein